MVYSGKGSDTTSGSDGSGFGGATVTSIIGFNFTPDSWTKCKSALDVSWFGWSIDTLAFNTRLFSSSRFISFSWGVWNVIGRSRI